MISNGSGWIRTSLKAELSPLGELVANLLGDVFGGIYHLDVKKLRQVDWRNPDHIVVQLAWKSLSTYDPPDLTWLVVLCHDRCLRLEISAKTVKTLELTFHARRREGRISERHPTIEEHIESIRNAIPKA